MIIVNIIVFALVIVVICSVDLSALTLDESTEHLLYCSDGGDTLNQSGNLDADGVDVSTIESEQNKTTDDECDTETFDKNDEVRDAVQAVEQEDMVGQQIQDESTSTNTDDIHNNDAETKFTPSAIEEDKMVDTQLAEAAKRREKRLAARNEYLKQQHSLKKECPRKPQYNEIKVPQELFNSLPKGQMDTNSGENASVGLSADFDDEFTDITDLIRDIHSKGE